MRGRSLAPLPIRQHLLTCDECVRAAMVEYDHLDKVRAGLANRVRPVRTEQVNGSFLAATPAAVLTSAQPEGQYVWAALVPMALAVGLMLSAHTRQEGSSAMMEAQAVRSTERPLSAHTSLDEDVDEMLDSEPTAVIPVRAPVRRRPVREVRIARAFVLGPQPASFSVAYPILAQPADIAHAFLMDVRLDDSEALSLVAADFELAPPPKRRSGFRRFFAALAAPFRMLAGARNTTQS